MTPSNPSLDGHPPRARLTKQQISEDQYGRMLRAMIATVAETGYAATTVAAVIRRAGVSRATFYQRFANRDECFFAAFDYASSATVARLEAALEPAQGLDRLLEVYLGIISGDPATARVLLVEASSLGAPGILRRTDNQRRFTKVVVTASGAVTDDDRFACEAFVAVVGAMVTARLADDDLFGIRALRKPLSALARRLVHGPAVA